MQRRALRRWPQAIRHNGRDYLTTAQVAKLLGVREATVYAYVSRGRIDSVRIEGLRGSVFAVSDVDAFMARSARRAPIGVVERIRTEVTLIEQDQLYFRGEKATDLAFSHDFIDVVGLLWGANLVDLPAQASAALTSCSELAVSQSIRSIDRLRLLVDLQAAYDPSRDDIASNALVAKGLQLIHAAVRALPLAGEFTSSSDCVAHQLWVRLSPLKPTSSRIRLLNAALVLLADNGMSVGAVSARVAASSRSSVYAAVASGLGAFDGPLHGGATRAAHAFLSQGHSDRSRIPTLARSSGSVPGCGHVIYRHRDPRADALLDALTEFNGTDSLMETIAAIRLASDAFVNVDLAIAAIAIRCRMSADAAETIFAVARIAGWIAHAMEEYRAPALRFRPEGVYVGIRPTT